MTTLQMRVFYSYCMPEWREDIAVLCLWNFCNGETASFGENMKLSRQKPISNLTISFYFPVTTFKASTALSFKERSLRIASCLCFSRDFFGSRPSCHTTALQTKHTQIPNTLKSKTLGLAIHMRVFKKHLSKP